MNSYVLNKTAYERAEVVDFYAREDELLNCEAYLFDKYIRPDDHILDIGVGGGRTTPYLTQKSPNYIGIDLSEGMIDACKRKFPKIDFRVMDAADLRTFENNSFDVVVFSFNGIGYLPTDATRHQCLNEIMRVLRPDGHFIFSCHNARALAMKPNFKEADFKKKVWRLIYAAYKTLRLTLVSLSRSSFYKGRGYIYTRWHGGMSSYVSTPKYIKEELLRAHFSFGEVLSNHYPGHGNANWYYYAFHKLSNNT